MLLELQLRMQRSYQPLGCYQHRLNPSFQREQELMMNQQIIRVFVFIQTS